MMNSITTMFEKMNHGNQISNGTHKSASKTLMELAKSDADSVLKLYSTTISGLGASKAHRLIGKYGLNEIVHEKREHWLVKLAKTFKNPLIILLLALGIISSFTKDYEAMIVILAMVLVSIFLRFFQEFKANKAAEKLKAMVKTTATVVRLGEKKEAPLNLLVPGDIIHLSAGDMVPADVRLITSKDLFVNQAVLTGEALPVEKHVPPVTKDISNPLELSNICFMGTNVESGTATAVVVMTGRNTYLGSLASSIAGQKALTSFDVGISRFTWLMIRFILVLVPLVFLINGLLKGKWLDAFLFALAVAIGLTPEMLPMIVTVNLSKGAIVMARKKVIVKSLNSIQNFGAMDILCTDKTGTITQGKVILEKHIDVFGNEDSEQVLKYTYLNSYYQTGLKSILDTAVLNHADLQTAMKIDKKYKKVDEVTFDFIRRRMSVVVEQEDGKHILICKGAVEEIMSVCKKAEAKGKIFSLGKLHHSNVSKIINGLNEDGFRVIAVAYKETSKNQMVYSVRDENNLVLLGFAAFLDPPKETAMKAISKLRQNGVQVKILTGDNEIVTKKICQEVKLPVERILLGSQIESMSNEQLSEAAENTTVFAKLLPLHKERIIKALKRKGHTVGFLGDGINDTPALKASDVSISVDTAVDIAKESSSIILLEKSLLVLEDGVIEGRKVFGNIDKYIKMAASSNFGNMISVVGASVFLPFLPMLPIQILINNMLYDFSQVSIPTDGVDEEFLVKPRQWQIEQIKRFIFFIGPISSIFDYVTFFIMIYVFNAWASPALFQTGWFIESLVTQTLIIHVIRTNKIPFIQSRASLPLMLTTVIIIIIGVWIIVSPIAPALGFVALPGLYWLFLVGIILSYIIVTQFVKMWFIRKYAVD